MIRLCKVSVRLSDMDMSTPPDQILLTSEALAVESTVAAISDPSAGGIAFFLGITRAETNADGRPLLALDYEAYPEMAHAQLADLARRARDRWHISRLAILHRTGRVAVGGASVLVAASTPHRAEAFEACKWLIDTLKSEAAIWKKEIWGDGTSTWVHPDL
jgi:molybdopterin synthase catalytic subunit